MTARRLDGPVAPGSSPGGDLKGEGREDRTGGVSAGSPPNDQILEMMKLVIVGQATAERRMADHEASMGVQMGQLELSRSRSGSHGAEAAAGNGSQYKLRLHYNTKTSVQITASL